MGAENPISIDLKDYCDAVQEHGQDMDASEFQHKVLLEPGSMRVDCPLGRVSPLLSVRPRIVIYESKGELKGEVGCNGCSLKRSGFSKSIPDLPTP